MIDRPSPVVGRNQWKVSAIKPPDGVVEAGVEKSLKFTWPG